MDILNERIMQDGKCYPGGILKVDSFINHQMDPTLMMQVAEEFVRIFASVTALITMTSFLTPMTFPTSSSTALQRSR